MNNMDYPKIHYPDIYVLEGGYCAYFKEFGQRCEPPEYIRMDDGAHAGACKEGLHQFHKFKIGRYKPYTSSQGTSKATTSTLPSQHPQQSKNHSKRNTAPISSPAQMFALAKAVRNLRGGTLMTFPEDIGNTTSESDDADTDIGDSPCPSPTKTGMFKSKKIIRSLASARTHSTEPLNLGVLRRIPPS